MNILNSVWTTRVAAFTIPLIDVRHQNIRRDLDSLLVATWFTGVASLCHYVVLPWWRFTLPLAMVGGKALALYHDREEH